MRKGDETKREILRAAEQLFCQKGYEAASMQEIVRAAGVSKGGIYHHFASKEEIMTLLSHQHAQESAERAEAQLADAPDDLARLNLLLIWRGSSCRRKTTSSRAICPLWWIC